MLRIAIVGCGKIADQHVEQILLIPDCRIVAVCDREELMAMQLQERLGGVQRFTDVAQMLSEVKPDVVHVTTPPQSHHSLGKLCLESGCNVYIEKPFTVTSADTEELLALAECNHLKVTVGHNAQFSHAASRARRLIGEGYLGGSPVHMESYYCYDLADPSYAKALFGDRYHWVRTLPGGLLQNTISHGISKIAEFLNSDNPEVVAYGFTSPLLQSIGETDVVDELRVIIRDPAGPTAYFTFSSQMRPALHYIRFYGPSNGLLVDENQQTVVRIRGARYKSFLEQFIPPVNFAREYFRNCLTNINKFLNNDFQSGYGMRSLISGFYTSVSKRTAPPIPYSEIRRTSWIMEQIFLQLQAAKAVSGKDVIAGVLSEAQLVRQA
jgi:predicted dehydrogenase